MQISSQLKWPARSFAMAVAFAISGAASVSMAQPVPREVGLWIDDTGKGAVRIEPCGSMLCGRIAWLKDLVNDSGEVLRDRHNPDPTMRDRLICGLPVLGQLQALPEGGYDGGWVYDPKVGKAFNVAIRLTGQDELTVTGYKGIRLFSKSFIWTRAQEDLQDCAAPTAELTGAAPAAPARPAAAKANMPQPQNGAKTAPAKKATAASNLGASDIAPPVKTSPKTSAKSSAQKAVPAKKVQKKEVLPWLAKQP